MRKLLGKPTPDAAHAAHAAHDAPSPAAVASIASSPLAPHHYRPATSQDVVYDAGVPIACLDRSADGRSAVLGGRSILKILSVDGVTIKETLDLRALIVAQPSQRNVLHASSADQLSIKAIKWGEPQGKPAIFTAGNGGKIFQYDLVHAAATAVGAPVDCIQIREDSRQVNALDINPHRNSWLLSGSQDGIVRCFDIRQPTMTRTGATFRSTQAFKCYADPVQHVQWNPRDGFLFACATEKGAVIKWDIRKPGAPLLHISAHSKAVLSMAWHQDGVHIATSSLDNNVKIWDLTKQDKRQKPKWSLATPAPAGVLSWRPGQWSATAQGRRASQIAVAYDESSQKRYGVNVVHLWDLARPSMPYREVQRFDASPSAMLWHDQYLLWTAGQDGIFSQCDMSFAPKVIDRQAVSTMAFSPRGDVVMLLDERPPPPRLRPHVSHREDEESAAAPAITTPRFGVSRSDSEDDAVGTFIGPRRRSTRRRRHSTRSITLSTTPPAGPSLEDVMSLEQTIKATGPYRPQQAMAVGHVPAATNPAIYGYLAKNYLEALYRDLPYSPGDPPLPDRVAVILEHYACAAASVKQFRLAQTWRILAYAVDLMLRRRAQYHLGLRMDRLHGAARKKNATRPKRVQPFTDTFNTQLHPVAEDGEETPRKVSSFATADKTLHPRSLLSDELDSSSNVPTPLAAPLPDVTPDVVPRGRQLTPVFEPGSFTLPPPAHPPTLGRKRLDSVPLSIASNDSAHTYASTEGYDFYDTEAILRKPIDVPSHKATSDRPRLHGESPEGRRMPRKDSDDSSAQMFSVSGDSSRGAGIKLPEYPSLPLPSLPRTDTGLTGFTDYYVTQTTTDSFESRYPSQPDNFVAESPTTPHSPDSPDAPDDDPSPFVVETDYLCWPDDDDYPYPNLSTSTLPHSTSTPIQPYTLISRALAFEAKSSALNASAMVLLLRPLLPENVIDRFQASAILRQHHSRLMSMEFYTEAALLRKMCMKGWPGAPLLSWGDNYPAIYSPAQQGVQTAFSCTSCNRPRNVDRSNSSDTIWQCGRCKASMAPCAICGNRGDAPSHLLPSGPPIAEPLSTWWYCPGCGHGGHASCLQAWHASLQPNGADAVPEMQDPPGAYESSVGCCPLDGCGHVCASDGTNKNDGSNRRSMEDVNRTVREATRAVAKAVAAAAAAERGAGNASEVADWARQWSEEHGALTPGEAAAEGFASAFPLGGAPGHGGHGGKNGAAVKSDGYDIPQSKAVETVREALGTGTGGTSGGGMLSGYGPFSALAGGGVRVGTGILSSSPGSRAAMAAAAAATGLGGDRERRKSVKFAGTDERR
jgi:WD40 repeat protein